jgi:acyl-CoA synthetase (AMP-forming)/AMP-acid ligase II
VRSPLEAFGSLVGWNLGDIFDAVGEAVPGERPALIHGDRTLTWADFTRRSNNLAAQLLARGARPGDKVALCMRNRPEYAEILAACCKARLVHVNVNFRYLDDELHYIFENSDSKFVVFAGEFAERVGKLRERLPKLTSYIQVDDGVTTAPLGEAYEELANAGAGEPLDLRRSPDDLLLVYTGGTTGMPKGVMWRSEDLWEALGRGANIFNHNTKPESLERHCENLRRTEAGVRQIPACPIMHGTGFFTSIGILAGGGTLVTLDSPHFDPHELWAAVSRHKVQSIVIVGDAFAKPLLQALDERPGAYDLSSLVLVLSSGLMWSPEVKRGLLRHNQRLVLVDTLGSSEALGFGTAVTTARGESRSAKFRIGESCKVFSKDGREIRPGSEEPGVVARAGPIPLGYYKDPEKSAQTFPTINGVRYSIPGDWCLVEEDGTLTLLGRGNVCINTAGEKVYPEEVEEVLKTHPDVEDAVVVGVPDERWGRAVTGVVELRAGAKLDAEALRRHVRSKLAGYKVPKRVLSVDSLDRAANGKADYERIRALAMERLGLSQ